MSDYIMEHVKKRSVNNFKHAASIGDGRKDINKPPRDYTFQRDASDGAASPRARYAVYIQDAFKSLT